MGATTAQTNSKTKYHHIRETVKTILLQQDPPYHKKRWWSLSVPSIPHLKRWCLGCIAPILSGVKTEKKIQTSLDCFTSNATFEQTKY